jgi:hypothetical protein
MNNQQESLTSSGSWFPNPQQMAKAAKSGGVLTMPTAPDPQKHLQDANKGKITDFREPAKPKS